MTHKLVLLLLVSASSLAAAQPSAATPGSEPAALAASAELQDVDGNVVGDVNITESESADGPLVTIQVGLEPDLDRCTPKPTTTSPTRRGRAATGSPAGS